MTVFLSGYLLAQFPDYHVRVFDEDQGIQTGRMIKVIKDSSGFIWMLYTDHIQRFDGKRITDFFTGEQLTSIQCDEKGRVWAGSTTKILRFKNDHEGFASIPFDTSGNIRIGNIFSLPGKRLWLLASKGFYEWDNAAGSFKKINYPGLQVKYPLESGDLFSVYGNTLFFVNHDSVFTCDISKHTHQSLPRKDASRLYALGNDLAIVTGRANNSFWYDFTSGEIKEIDIKRDLGEKENIFLFVRDVQQLDNSRWLIASHLGILELDLKTRHFRQVYLYYKGKPVEKNPLYVDLFLDKQQNIWLIHRTGLIFFRPMQEEIGLIRNNEPDPQKAWQNNARNLVSDKKGNIWITTSHGLGYWDLKKNSILIYPAVEGAVNRLSAPSVRGLAYDGRHLILGTSTDGVWLYDPEKKNYSRPVYEKGKTGDSIRQKFEKKFISHINSLHNGDLLIAAGNCYIMNGKSYLLKPLELPDSASSATFSYQDSYKQVWIGCNKDLFCLDSNLVYKYHVSLDRTTQSMCEINPGKWLVGTTNGLYCMQLQSGEPVITDEIDFFKNTRNAFVTKDNNNKIWVGSNKGLCRFDASTKKTEVFDYTDNVQSDVYSANGFYQAKDGMLFLGGDNGINYFHPEKIKEQTDSLQVSIMKVVVNQDDTGYNDFTNPFRLKYFQNSLAIDFVAPYYGNLSRLQYRYRMEGIDTAWKSNGNSNTIRFTSLAHGNYTFRVASSLNGVDWFESRNKLFFVISPPFWKTRLFYVLIAVLVLLLATLLYRRRMTYIKLQQAANIERLKAKQAEAEKELQLSNLNHDLAASKLTALRSQMNPHFIFNALNSVQQYILQGNVTEANKYLSKFSRLQREILHYSNENFILLEKEIEILNAYLQLEQLRFGENFTYQIDIANEIDPGEIKIPPMMLQPFIENAIWHGLMPKPGERNLKIHFDIESEDILLATIRDNGIGREASAKLKQNRTGTPDHQSKGMSLVYQRMHLLQQQYHQSFEVSVSDIMDLNGTVQGTQVILKIFIGGKQL